MIGLVKNHALTDEWRCIEAMDRWNKQRIENLKALVRGGRNGNRGFLSYNYGGRERKRITWNKFGCDIIGFYGIKNDVPVVKEVDDSDYIRVRSAFDAGMQDLIVNAQAMGWQSPAPLRQDARVSSEARLSYADAFKFASHSVITCPGTWVRSAYEDWSSYWRDEVDDMLDGTVEVWGGYLLWPMVLRKLAEDPHTVQFESSVGIEVDVGGEAVQIVGPGMAYWIDRVRAYVTGAIDWEYARYKEFFGKMPSKKLELEAEERNIFLTTRDNERWYILHKEDDVEWIPTLTGRHDELEEYEDMLQCNSVMVPLQQVDDTYALYEDEPVGWEGSFPTEGMRWDKYRGIYTVLPDTPVFVDAEFLYRMTLCERVSSYGVPFVTARTYDNKQLEKLLDGAVYAHVVEAPKTTGLGDLLNTVREYNPQPKLTVPTQEMVELFTWSGNFPEVKLSQATRLVIQLNKAFSALGLTMYDTLQLRKADLTQLMQRQGWRQLSIEQLEKLLWFTDRDCFLPMEYNSFGAYRKRLACVQALAADLDEGQPRTFSWVDFTLTEEQRADHQERLCLLLSYMHHRNSTYPNTSHFEELVEAGQTVLKHGVHHPLINDDFESYLQGNLLRREYADHPLDYFHQVCPRKHNMFLYYGGFFGGKVEVVSRVARLWDDYPKNTSPVAQVVGEFMLEHYDEMRKYLNIHVAQQTRAYVPDWSSWSAQDVGSAFLTCTFARTPPDVVVSAIYDHLQSYMRTKLGYPYDDTTDVFRWPPLPTELQNNEQKMYVFRMARILRNKPIPDDLHDSMKERWVQRAQIALLYPEQVPTSWHAEAFRACKMDVPPSSEIYRAVRNLGSGVSVQEATAADMNAALLFGDMSVGMYGLPTNPEEDS